MERNDKSIAPKKKSHNSRRNWSNVKNTNNESLNNKKKKNTDKKYVLSEQEKTNSEAIKVLKLNKTICPMCNEPIADIATCLADRQTNVPVHFDCVLNKLNADEKLLPNQKIVYVGKGCFAVVEFENPRDTRHFKILRQIEWEKRDLNNDWRSKIAGLYSQVH
jgi:hypothetical protein